MTISALCLTLLSLLLPCNSYTIQSRASTRNLSTRLHAGADFNDDVSVDRRQAIGTLLALGTLAPTTPSFAVESFYNANCLSDLPPLSSDCVRVYLSRHGQTENNRLRIIQGSRVNPPINDYGKLQAERLGQALSNASPNLEKILYSPLYRTRQTAQIAAEQFSVQPKLELLPSLAEIDFGAVGEGQPVEQYRSTMVATYTAWAIGELDKRMDGGESLEEILIRVENALQALAEEAAASQSRCIAAVAHSSYLRILLATLQDKSLLEASTIEQKNCAINVLDLKRNGTKREVKAKSRLLGGRLSRAPSDFSLTIPKGKVIRINEKRHLGELII